MKTLYQKRIKHSNYISFVVQKNHLHCRMWLPVTKNKIGFQFSVVYLLIFEC